MYAAFLQGTLPNGATAQILLTPTQPVRTYYRVATPGARGVSARWEEVTGNEATLLAPLLDHQLDVAPVAVRFTDADLRQMTDRGVPTTLGTKALSAKTRALSVPATFGDYFAGGVLIEQVRQQDPIVVSWYVDGRTAPSGPKIPPPAVKVTTVAAPIATPQDVTTTVGTVHTVNQQPAMCMATVPDVSIAEAYVHRQVYGADDFEVFRIARDRRENVLIKGPTGAAKTMSALAFAAEQGMPTFTISGSVNFEASEAFGQMMLDPATGMPYFQYGGAIEVIRDGGVLILDEINFIPSKVITPLYPLLDQRREVILKQNRGEVIKAHPNLLIVATMNPGYFGTQQMNWAVLNRFDHHLDWGYDEAVEKRLVPSKALRELAKQLREAEAGKKILTPTPTNALMAVIRNVETFGVDYAVSNFLARYDDADQQAVRLILQSQRANIAADFGLDTGVVVESDEVAATTDTTDTAAPIVTDPNAPANSAVAAVLNAWSQS